MSDLLNRFRKALGPGTFNQDVVSREFQKIVDRYSKPRRAYHNLEHLNRLFTLCDELEIEDHNNTLAIFYHDVIYNPKFANNEKRSAVFARRSLAKMGINRERSDRIGAMILATRDHLSGDHDQATELFLDLDISILGAELDDYGLYSDGVKSEHPWIPDNLYRRNRRKFLEKILESEHVFRTEKFRKKFEGRARENISRELESI